MFGSNYNTHIVCLATESMGQMKWRTDSKVASYLPPPLLVAASTIFTPLVWCGRDSNPCPHAPKADALQTELSGRVPTELSERMPTEL